MSGTTWAFVDNPGASVVIEDVATAKVAKTIATGVKNNAGVQELASDGSKVVVVYGMDKAGTLAVLDVGAGKAKKVAGQQCTQ